MSISDSGTTRESQIVLSGIQVAVPTFLMLAVCIQLAEESAEQRAVLDGRSLPEVVVTVAGSLLYTTVGAVSLLNIRQDVGLTPRMAYTNSFMCWSAFFFGFIQIYTDSMAGVRWPLKFDYWFTLPNFGWGIEWGLHLLAGVNGEVCGLRAAILMGMSIASIGLEYIVPGKMGYNLAILPQVLGAILMSVYCIRSYYSEQATRALYIFLIACIAFLVLHEIDGFLPVALTEATGYETGKIVVIKLSDNTQIYFSIRFFVEMFRTKRRLQLKEKSL